MQECKNDVLIANETHSDITLGQLNQQVGYDVKGHPIYIASVSYQKIPTAIAVDVLNDAVNHDDVHSDVMDNIVYNVANNMQSRYKDIIPNHNNQSVEELHDILSKKIL
jgi:hypothetical protein